MVEQKLCVTLGSSTNLGVFCVLPSTKNLASPCATCFPWRKNDLRSWCFWYKKSCHDYSVGGPSVFWRWWGIQHQDQIIVFAEICIGMWNCCFIATREKKLRLFSERFLCQGMVHPRLNMIQIGHWIVVASVGVLVPPSPKPSKQIRDIGWL